jgi:hypothetical protein
LFQDLGGQTSIRPYWRCYYANTAAVIFVIDSTDIERLGTAADELAAMLNEDELRDAALLVFANKQDQPGAKGAGEISEALKLGELRDRNWSIVACSAIDGKGINEGMDWLVVCFPTLPSVFTRFPKGFLHKLDADHILTQRPFYSKPSRPKTHDARLCSRAIDFCLSFDIPCPPSCSRSLEAVLLHSGVLCHFFSSTLLRPAEPLSYIAT